MPRPPPRSRPRSWTSTLFNAMLRNGTSLSKKNGNGNAATLPYGRQEREYHDDEGPEYSHEAEYGYSQGSSLYGTAGGTPGGGGTVTNNMTGTLDKRGSKQVRFLANPSKPADGAHPRFYSLPRFILPGVTAGEGRERGGQRPSTQPAGHGEDSTAVAAKLKMRSRTPSPFGRFVKSLVRGMCMFANWPRFFFIQRVKKCLHNMAV